VLTLGTVLTLAHPQGELAPHWDETGRILAGAENEVELAKAELELRYPGVC
jgi:hypothetical protein